MGTAYYEASRLASIDRRAACRGRAVAPIDHCGQGRRRNRGVVGHYRADSLRKIHVRRLCDIRASCSGEFRRNSGPHAGESGNGKGACHTSQEQAQGDAVWNRSRTHRRSPKRLVSCLSRNATINTSSTRRDGKAMNGVPRRHPRSRGSSMIWSVSCRKDTIWLLCYTAEVWRQSRSARWRLVLTLFSGVRSPRSACRCQIGFASRTHSARSRVQPVVTPCPAAIRSRREQRYAYATVGRRCSAIARY